MNNLIAKTKFNNTEYKILQNGENIEFISEKNNKINGNLTEEEIKILSYIYDNIRIEQKALVFMGNLNLFNNIYSIFMDKRTNMYTLLLKKNEKYYVPPIEENELFNMYYNYQPSILFNNNELDDNNSDDEKNTPPKSKAGKFF